MENQDLPLNLEDYNVFNFFKESFIKLNDFLENINERKEIDDSEKDLKNIITLRYEKKENDLIRIFGDEFVWRNKNKCKIIINNEEKDLCNFIDTTNILLNNNILEITLIKTKNIINISHMFDNCNLLKTISDFSEWGTKNVTDISYLFYGCENLINL